MLKFNEALRRIYHEMVYRRSIVRIHKAKDLSLKEPPIFILGLYRSGTTLLLYILDSHSRICCPPESAFIQFLEPLVDNRRSKSGLFSMGFDEDHIIQRLRHHVIYFFANYADSKKKVRWADKSPIYVDHLNFLIRLFPEGKFIIIHRHGLDQAYSHIKYEKSLAQDLKSYCRANENLRIGATRYWIEKTQFLIDFEETHSKRCFRTIYEELCESPDDILQQVFLFLDEPWEPQVMEFYKFPHDKGLEDGRVISSRGFSVSKDNYLQWPDELQTKCHNIALPMLKRLGYSV